jgi:hypothetical protein
MSSAAALGSRSLPLQLPRRTNLRPFAGIYHWMVAESADLDLFRLYARAYPQPNGLSTIAHLGTRRFRRVHAGWIGRADFGRELVCRGTMVAVMAHETKGRTAEDVAEPRPST